MDSRRGVRHHAVGFLALTTTPWLILISTSNTLFLENQAALDFNPLILAPFLLTSGCCLIGAFFLRAVARRRPGFRRAIWIYYGLGPLFLLFSLLREVPFVSSHRVIHVFPLVVAFCLLELLLRRFDPGRAEPFLACFAALLIFADFATFARKWEPPPADRLKLETDIDGPRRPNIYHVLFDGYQSDVFSHLLGTKLEEVLEGFVFFPKNTASASTTYISVSSVFLGQPWDHNVPPREYRQKAFNSKHSLLHGLKTSGYETTGYLHRNAKPELSLFDNVYYNHNAAKTALIGGYQFYWVWLYRYVPRPLVKQILGDQLFQRVAIGKLAPNSYVLASKYAFDAFLARELSLGDWNRYTFLHLILPHPPFLLNSECGPQAGADPIEQFRCANTMIRKLIQTLKKLARFKESLVLIHADHGLGFEFEGGKLRELPRDPRSVEWSHLFSKALLLWKPPGQGAEGEVYISDAETTLLDIKTTVLESVGTSPSASEGVSLLRAKHCGTPRRRYFHSLNADLRDEAYLFTVERDRFEFDTVLRPEGFEERIPSLPVGRPIGVEDAHTLNPGRAITRSDQPKSSDSYMVGADLILKFLIDEAGTYRFRMRAVAEGPQPAIAQIGLLDEPYMKWDIEPSSQWSWRDAPVDWFLGVGESVVLLRNRRGSMTSALMIDQLALERVD